MTTERPRGRIFLSYRRSDAQHITGRVFDRLEVRFGVGNVFMDVDSIEPGLDFAEAIDQAVGSCDVLLAVIGKDWLSAVDDQHRRRLDDPDDLIVLEIATALRRGIRVIPVLVEGASPPRRDDLPEILAPLARRQAVHLDHAGFNTTMTALATTLERVLASPHPEPDPPRATREWTTEDFALLLRDHRPSARRIVAVLDELARKPEVEVPLSALATATGLSRGELRGAFKGLTFLCKQLRPGVAFNWPINWRHGISTLPGQAQETWYHIPSAVAEQWGRTHRG